MNIVEVLKQEQMWYGQDGYPHRLDTMEQSHRQNVQAFLRRRADSLYLHYLWSIRHERFFDRVILEDPGGWLERQPFMLALDRAINRHDSIDAEVLEIE